MESKELSEWIRIYEEKTGDTFQALPGFTTWYLPDRGFCQWKPVPESRAVLCWNLCNDAHFWRDALECMVLQFGYDRIITICILPKQGREVVCTPKENDDGTIDYYVTNELRRPYKPWKNANERE